MNPSGLIPALETPAGALFETGAIVLWLFGSSAAGRYDKAKEDYQSAYQEAKNFERLDPYPTAEHLQAKKLSVQNYAEQTEALQKAFDAYLRSGEDDGLRGLELVGKSMSTAVNSDGGYLVDPQTSERVQSVLLSTSSIRSIALSSPRRMWARSSALRMPAKAMVVPGTTARGSVK